MSYNANEETHLDVKSMRCTYKIKILSKFQLKTFWQQLLSNDSYFMAGGICKIDRELLTAVKYLNIFVSKLHILFVQMMIQFLAAIATYLVILLQFALNEDSSAKTRK